MDVLETPSVMEPGMYPIVGIGNRATRCMLVAHNCAEVRLSSLFFGTLASITRQRPPFRQEIRQNLESTAGNYHQYFKSSNWHLGSQNTWMRVHVPVTQNGRHLVGKKFGVTQR